MAAKAKQFAAIVRGCKALALTGSGSSEFAGACLHLPLRVELNIPVEAIPAALILTVAKAAFPTLRPGLLVSLALFCGWYLWIAFSREKRGLHDLLAGTYVVRARRPEAVVAMGQVAS